MRTLIAIPLVMCFFDAYWQDNKNVVLFRSPYTLNVSQVSAGYQFAYDHNVG